MPERLRRRLWPLGVSVAFVVLGTAYTFLWPTVVRHRPYLWLIEPDLRITYNSAAALAFGHFGSIYNIGGGGFLAFPGFLILLFPVARLAATFNEKVIEVGRHYQTIANPIIQHIKQPGLVQLSPTVGVGGGHHFVLQPQWVVFVAPYVMVLSCLALFAFDALAERLGVLKERRAVLVCLEAVLLWNVTVFWGHPEDAVAVAFAVYALIFAIDRRFAGAGWLFGAALACQPLVILMLPILLVMAGWPAAVGMAVRAVAPAAVLTAIPLAANYDATVHAVAKQPTYPLLDHETPWTTFARPVTSSKGYAVSGGANRVVAFALVCGLAAWSRRWRNRPELLAWACALALAVRCYTESVMTAYYLWPALALGMVVAAKTKTPRFTGAAVLAVATTVVAQWHLAWLTWWCLVMAGLTGVLILAARPAPVVAEEPTPPRDRARPRKPATQDQRVTRTGQRRTASRLQQTPRQRRRNSQHQVVGTMRNALA